MVVRTLRLVKEGSEILDCYGPHFLTNAKKDRQEFLLRKYHFTCKCEACTKDWSSDLSTKQLRRKDKTWQRRFEECAQKRVDAIALMYEGNYEKALPLLLEHANFGDKCLAPSSFDAIKTQQSIVQCFNSASCTAP